MPTKTPEFDPALILVTPHITGQRVKDAQWLLSGHSRFEGLAPYKDGDLDGDYGPVTAQATKRAKFWLGYALRSCDESFGQTLYEYLRPEHWRPLPEAYRQRRDKRIEEAAQTPGATALGLAIGELGYKETPKNRTKYGVDYGWNGVAWCAIFLSYCFKHTGYTRFHYAAVENIYYDALNGRNNLRIVSNPKAGDLATYSLPGGGRFSHTAFFEQWLDQPHGRFQDLGGNTGPASVNNGGEVARGERSMSQVLAFVRAG